jgi:signal transduction histidine kinase
MKNGGELSIQVKNTDEAMAVSIQDTGIGMSKGEIERIFQPFYSTREKGIGLGLSIAHRIVEQHSGWIDVVSRPGRGSRFTVWLPTQNTESEDGSSNGL